MTAANRQQRPLGEAHTGLTGAAARWPRNVRRWNGTPEEDDAREKDVLVLMKTVASGLELVDGCAKSLALQPG